MNNPQFYIFGVPDGFDMYNATPEKVKFFQLMYDGLCREKRRMVIHRNADNSEVTYIYLRYDMRSFTNRPASFLGLALTFSGGKYCTEIPLLLNLFESIYKALSSDVVLSTKIPAGQGQGRYTIRRFADRTAAIIKIEEFVEAQTRGWFDRCVVSLDETFLMGSQDVVQKHGLFLDTKSEHIIANMKTASWVYLSDRGVILPPPPESSAKPDPQPKPEPSSAVTPQPTPSQQPVKPVVQSPADTDKKEEERQRRMAEKMVKIKEEFSKENNVNYYHCSQAVLLAKRVKYVDLQSQLNALGISSDSNQLYKQITTGINLIDRCIDQIDRKKKRNKLSIGFIAGFVLLGIVVCLHPWKPTPSTDNDWQAQRTEWKTQLQDIDRIVDSLGKAIEEMSGYSEYETYRKARLAQQSAKQYSASAKSFVGQENFSEYKDSIGYGIKHAQEALQNAKDYWNQFIKEQTESSNTDDSKTNKVSIEQNQSSGNTGSGTKKKVEKQTSQKETQHIKVKVDGLFLSCTKTKREKGILVYEYNDEWRSQQPYYVYLFDGDTPKEATWTPLGGVQIAENNRTNIRAAIKSSTGGGTINVSPKDAQFKIQIHVREKR